MHDESTWQNGSVAGDSLAASSAPAGKCYAEGRARIGNRGEFSLAEVHIQDGETLENALRRFKRKVLQEDIIKEVKRHAFYLKPGQKKRVKEALARKRNRKKRSRDGEPEPNRQ